MIQEKKISKHKNRIESNNLNSIKRSLRNINSCFKVPNLFLNKNQDNLTQNIEFIPKHIRRKIIEKQFLICKDILDLEFDSQRPKVDIITVKTAAKLQLKYQNIISNSCQELIMKENPINQSAQVQNQLRIIKKQEQDYQFRDLTMEKVNQQLLKCQIPTEKELKKTVDY